MKHLSTLIIVLGTAITSTLGADTWQTDRTTAQTRASAENRLLLMNFTGSDWCPWCVKLKKEVFETSEFKDYAARNLVLLEVDFPRKKELSPDLKKANEALRKEYAIRGYPTVVVLDSKLKKIGQLQYMAGGPKVFLGALEKLRK